MVNEIINIQYYKFKLIKLKLKVTWNKMYFIFVYSSMKKSCM
jgi:hypothetical protein